MPEAATTTPASNGAGVQSVRERVAEQLRAAIDELAAVEQQIAEQLAAVKTEKHDLERSLRPLTGAPAAPKAKQPAKQPGRSNIGPERLAQIKETVLRLAEGDAEFRQADVGRELGFSSAITSVAFAQLTDASVIRLARRQKGPGGGNYYRLTRPALREQP
jgi:hypothetical protein